MLSGCSFTDPQWQSNMPWSVQYSKKYPSYIVAKAGMGIKGICTETLYNLKDNLQIEKLILMLPTLWRMDIEVDEETYLCNAMVDRVWSENGDFRIDQTAKRKWLTSGGLNYIKTTEQGKLFDTLYRHQGFLVLLKEQIRALTTLLEYCRANSIQYYITAIQDPMEQLDGLDYVRHDIETLLQEAEYDTWLRFDDKFIDKFLQLNHLRHPNTQEHEIICKYVSELTS